MAAPIILLAFKRYEHLKKVVESIQRCPEYIDSDLHVYIDRYKSLKDKESNEKVINYCRSISNFKSVRITIRSVNYGLKNNIESAIDEVFQIADSAIILEDDIVVNEKFLYFMNYMLDKYKNDTSIWHISGWNYPVKTVGIDSPGNTYFKWSCMNCWGWATWANRWRNYRSNVSGNVFFDSFEQLKKFNIDTSFDFVNQLIDNQSGKIHTWAIYWYKYIFFNNGQCINPIVSFTENIGQDGSGTNSGKTNPITTLYRRSNQSNDLYCIGEKEGREVLKRIVEYNRSRFKRISLLKYFFKNTISHFIYYMRNK